MGFSLFPLTMSQLRCRALLAVAPALFAVSFAIAQDKTAADYPNRPIRIIVSVPAGGGVDLVTRVIADKLQQRWGQPVIVENRGGTSGNIGAEAVFAAEPDGYTLLAAQPAPLTVNVLLYKKLAFDPAAFEPVAIMTSIPNTLTVRPGLPAKTVQELIAYAKANPQKLNYASQGNATTSHLTAELFQQLTGIKLIHIPYKGTAPALTDLIGGHVDLMFTELASALPHHRASKARLLAVTSQERVPTLPDIPTLSELGLPGFRSDTWNAIAAPPRTPPAIIAKLNAAINDALAQPDVRNHLLALSLTPVGGTPADLAALMKAETRRWGDVIRAAQVTLD